VVRVLELDILKAFIGGNETIADDLNLRLVRDGLEIWVENATLCVEGLAMTVACSFGIEALGKLELSLWGDVALVFEDYDLVVV